MLRRAVLIVAFAAIACGKSEPANEKTYPLTATIVSRDPAQNNVTMDNKEIPGVMEAMRMDYRVRDVKVTSLPPDGTPVTATLHERGGDFWVTGIRAAPPR